MPKLKIILQSKTFIILSLIFLVLYCFLVTKVIKYSSKYDLGEITLEVKVLDYDIDGDKLSFNLQALEKLVGNYYFSSKMEKEELVNSLKLGQTLIVKGEISEPLNNTIPNSFNYKNYLNNKRIYRIINIYDIEIKEAKIPFLYQIKNYFYERARKLDNKGYIQAFILGNKNMINSEIYTSFSNNGITHLFAVSGMHISFLLSFLNWLLLKLKIKENYTYIIILPLLFIYMFLIGFSASVVRASLLYIFLIMNKKLKLNLNTLNVLYILALILIIINPFYIYDLGFIYSFVTAFGLMLFSQKIKGNYLKKLLLVSGIAFLFSLPITLSYNYEFNLLTILNNIIIVPFVSLILFPLCILTFIFPFLASILNFLITILQAVSLFLDKIGIYIVIAKISPLFIALYYGIVYLIFKYNFKYIILIIALIITAKVLPYLDSKEYVYFLDVNQGDSALIISSYKKEVIMVDTGGVIKYPKEEWQIRNREFSLSYNIISFLHSLGISQLDLLAISHGDIDHLGYAKEILKKIKVKNLMLNNNALNKEESDLKQLVKSQITNNYQTSNIQIQNLNAKNSQDENTSSLVLYIKLKNNNLLLMGDAPKEVEKTIIQKYQLSVDILKLGHHGSKTSSDYLFLETIKPKYSIISAGRNNRYNHPSLETIKTLETLKLNYYSTQNKGTIEFIFSHKNLKQKFYEP